MNLPQSVSIAMIIACELVGNSEDSLVSTNMLDACVCVSRIYCNRIKDSHTSHWLISAGAPECPRTSQPVLGDECTCIFSGAWGAHLTIYLLYWSSTAFALYLSRPPPLSPHMVHRFKPVNRTARRSPKLGKRLGPPSVARPSSGCH